MKKWLLLFLAVFSLSSCEYFRLVRNAVFPPAKYDLTKGILGTDMESYPQYIDDILKEETEKGIITSPEEAEFYAIGADVWRTGLDDVAKASKALIKILSNKETSYFRVFYLNCDSDRSVFGEEGGSAFTLRRDEENQADYEDYKQILFHYADVKPILEKVPAVLKEALERTEDKSSYVSFWEIKRNHQTEAFEIEVKTTPMGLVGNTSTFLFDADGKLIQ